MVLGKQDSYMSKNETNNTIHKNKLKCTKDLNAKPEPIKLLEENIGSTLFGIYHTRILFDPLPRVMEIKTK